MNKRVIAVMAAAVLALAGIAALLLWASNADQRAFEGAELTSVVQVTAAVPAGTAAESLAESTEIREVPATAVPEGAVTDLEDVAGRVTTTDLVVGEILLGERLVQPGDDGAEAGAVPEGLQEITLSLEPAQLMGGNLAPGDVVGVIAGFDGPGETAMLQENVLVTGVGQPSGVTEEGQVASLVTLAVSGADAKRIANVGLYGRVWLTKQNDATKGTDGVTGRDGVLR